MPVIKVSVKWSGKKFDDIEIDTDDAATVFKATLFSLTGVPPDRQKIMVKGGMLKEETDLNSLGIKAGHQFMMMGTAGELPKEPPKKTVFLEDMSGSELAQAMEIPNGLVNLGNTCYMNATLQTLRAIPELQDAMKQLSVPLSSNPRQNIAVSLRDLYRLLDTTPEAVPPLVFLQVLRSAFPQYAEQSARGGYAQQDAEECWTSLVSSLKDTVPGKDNEGKWVKPSEGRGWVEEYMTGEMEHTLTCDEDPNEPKKISTDTFSKIQINISQGVVTYMASELEQSLTSSLEKRSESLDRNAKYTQKSAFSRLPAYLAVQFVRFQWKPQEGVKAKILKRVKFPFELDMNPYTTKELAEKLKPGRDYVRKRADEKEAEKKKSKAEKRDASGEVKKSEPQTSGGDPMDVVQTSKTVEQVYGEIGLATELRTDIGASVTGIYDLIGVVTHIGRTAEGGHYIGWVRKGLTDDWFKFDDDKVSPVRTEDITKLEGGGEYHAAYICLYKTRSLLD
ncbi:ubiquitin carboxyl-terminal hydrolase 14 [Gonapodya prolifera JEL478]|uniref:Ubiquitin carboxyl-terminal hydrolase n=1 Tax=Gonapodya prolifera (strain JEL478) TaxID=1344416 RepID=A0A139AQB5_GONPJ|nr:ubiquitin carboxyl-terminal hydrolase 14 [Gonapodya prolifera JEL478]|eukprot:KXS18912.1 ubiquitin carboxyl-terminal hydrolase 14 [Gonapodya prolifera JEL478]